MSYGKPDKVDFMIPFLWKNQKILDYFELKSEIKTLETETEKRTDEWKQLTGTNISVEKTWGNKKSFNLRILNLQLDYDKKLHDTFKAKIQLSYDIGLFHKF